MVSDTISCLCFGKLWAMTVQTSLPNFNPHDRTERQGSWFFFSFLANECFRYILITGLRACMSDVCYPSRTTCLSKLEWMTHIGGLTTTGASGTSSNYVPPACSRKWARGAGLAMSREQTPVYPPHGTIIARTQGFLTTEIVSVGVFPLSVDGVWVLSHPHCNY